MNAQRETRKGIVSTNYCEQVKLKSITYNGLLISVDDAVVAVDGPIDGGGTRLDNSGSVGLFSGEKGEEG